MSNFKYKDTSASNYFEDNLKSFYSSSWADQKFHNIENESFAEATTPSYISEASDKSLLSVIENRISSVKHSIAKSYDHSYTEIQKLWIGTIQKINKDEQYVEAIVKDDATSTKEYMKIALKAFKNEEDMIQEGAVFYWTIGWFTDSKGSLTKQSKIRIRRLPGLSDRDIKIAKNKASVFLDKLLNNE